MPSWNAAKRKMLILHLMAMFLGSDPCTGDYGEDSDHTDCCRAHSVQRTAAGGKYLIFCQMSLESNFQADISMIPCWAVFKEIKQCFRHALIQKNSIKKTT
ncbi:unnamed protein product [Onchocerca flexuosa]|uniref:DB domain-containing protein n=1 Tax=Onchocerca flexuosa TaxID=387005 RepID=A0A183HBZ1_9BILA|nr:unnamed protein product [Onchocerca flexuosa]